MGLPGSGKTTLANELAPLLSAKRLRVEEIIGDAYKMNLIGKIKFFIK